MKKKTVKEIMFFFILSCALSWFLWSLAYLSSKENTFLIHNKILMQIGNFVPSIAAVILTAVALGKKGVRELLARIFAIRFGVLWHIYAFILMPCILLIAFLSAHYFAHVKFSSLLLPIILPQFWPLLLLIPYFVIAQGPLGEELGWRGYALDRLVAVVNPLKASFVLGFIWSVWHIPLFFIQGTIQCSISDSYGIGIALLGYTIYTTMITIMMTLLHIKTKRSIFAALIFHAMANFSHGLVTILTSTGGGLSILGIMLVAALSIIIFFRKEFLNCPVKIFVENRNPAL